MARHCHPAPALRFHEGARRYGARLGECWDVAADARRAPLGSRFMRATREVEAAVSPGSGTG